MEFVDAKDYLGPFDGLFIILNIGDKSALDSMLGDEEPEAKALSNAELGVPTEYEEALLEAIGEATSAGFCVLFLHEGFAKPVPQQFDIAEGMVFTRPTSLLGIGPMDFSSDPDDRLEQFKALAGVVREYKEFNRPDGAPALEGKENMIMGSCKISGKKALMPLVKFTS